jgi:uncharacterized protein (TIGR02147 family)
MDIFKYTNYKLFINNLVKSMPKAGRGFARNLAEHLNISSVSISQILKGDRDFSIEQACLVGDFLGLSGLEAQYFVGMVEYARAGTTRLKTFVQSRQNEIREKSQDLRFRLNPKGILSDEAKATFYSNWQYSAVRLMTTIDGATNANEIAARLNLQISTVQKVLKFLVDSGLCIEQNNSIKIGPNSTHVSSTSPFVKQHHINWRFKAIESMDNTKNDDLHFTMPCSLSREVFGLLRNDFLKLIEDAPKKIDLNPEEILGCINIDLFKVVE